jgi:hypothetical protein
MLRFIDSFDHYDTTHIVGKWTSIAGAGNMVIDTGHPRNGRGCGAFTASGARKTIPSTTTYFVGGAFQWNGFGGGVALLDAQDNVQVEWSVGLDGLIRAFSGAGGTLGVAPIINAVNLNRYFYVEIGRAHV